VNTFVSAWRGEVEPIGQELRRHRDLLLEACRKAESLLAPGHGRREGGVAFGGLK
jgi:hypothetical protein